jgi:magnesium transporter
VVSETTEQKKLQNSSEDSVFGLDPSIEKELVEALDAGQVAQVAERIATLHHADIADLLERIRPESRHTLVEAIPGDLVPEVLSELDETVRDEIIEQLGIKDFAAAVAEMDSNDAVLVIEELDEDEKLQVLEAIPDSDRSLIEEGLSYPEDSAGRLMQRELVSVPTYWTVGQTIDFMRQGPKEGEDERPSIFYDIFVVDPARRPVGAIPLSKLLQAQRPVLVNELMAPKIKKIPVAMDQEDVAFVFSQRDLVSAAVVDEGGRLVGAITIDDVVDVIHEEHEEDIMRMGGVSEDDLYEAALGTTRSRFSWLLVNLGTAIIASVVISFFSATIEQMVALAVLMPIVASMGGNAGTQSMTVAVRALAMKELTETNALRVVGKELLVGGVNGILFAVLTGVIAWVWFSSPTIGIVIALAMIINLIVAGLAGTAIPVLLERNGIDPAIASGVLLTTITDVIGFAAFLGLAGIFLL